MTYFIRRGDSEFGPYTVPQLNQMRSRREITGADLCRAFDSTDYHTLAELFPHMADFASKTQAEKEREKWKIEGGSLASAGWVAGSFAAFGLLGEQTTRRVGVVFTLAAVGIGCSYLAARYGRWFQAMVGFLICTAVIVAEVFILKNSL